MSKKNYIRLNRSLMSHWLWPVGRPFSEMEAWLFLLMNAAHTTHKQRHDKKLLTVHVGEYITTAVELAQAWHWDRRTVSTFLKTLEEDDMISTERCARVCTRIKLSNYSLFQGKTEDDCTEVSTALSSGYSTGECTRNAQAPPLEASQGDEKGPAIKKGIKRVKKELIVCPENFSITDEMRAWAKEKLGDVSWLESETEQFIIYWRERGTKRPGWEATWKTRMLKQLEYRGGKVNPEPARELTIEEIDPLFRGAK